MKIKVTQEDIQQGYRGQATNCPVALAVGRILHRPIGDIIISPILDDWWVSIYPEETRHTLPKEVGLKIGVYDRYSEMEPFEFELDVPNNTTENPQS
jgi:hypothetical protein